VATPERNPIVRWTFLAAGWLCLALALIGVALPLVPTTPFLLLAAFAFARGSKELHVWLINHPRLGPPIEQWRLHHAISRRAKWAGTLSMVALVVISRVLDVDPRVILLQIGVLAVVTVFLWSRPDPPPESGVR
jgi:uncharacterized membrane protein YbaN (DUF454 family)